jgi:hypothetical protein
MTVVEEVKGPLTDSPPQLARAIEDKVSVATEPNLRMSNFPFEFVVNSEWRIGVKGGSRNLV